MLPTSKLQGGDSGPFLHTSLERGGESVFEARSGPRYESVRCKNCVHFLAVCGQITALQLASR